LGVCVWTVCALLATALAVRAATWGLGTDVDTGCFLVMVRSMAEGKALYRDILCNLPPLTFHIGRALYAAAPAHLTEASRCFMILATGSCVIPVYLAGARLFGRRAAIFAGLFYSLDLISVFHARNLHVSTLEAVAAAWVLWLFVLALDAGGWKRRLLIGVGGAACGTAFMVKQSSLSLLGAFAVLSFLLNDSLEARPSVRRMGRDLVPFAIGLAAALTPWAVHFALRGLMGEVYYGLVEMNLALRRSGVRSGSVGAAAAKLRLLLATACFNPWPWLGGFVGVVVALRRRMATALIPAAWLGAYGAFFGLAYYESNYHYLLPWIPALALLAGEGAAAVVEGFRRSLLDSTFCDRFRVATGAGGLIGLAVGLLLLLRDRGDLASFAFAAAGAAWLCAVGGRKPRFPSLSMRALRSTSAFAPARTWP